MSTRHLFTANYPFYIPGRVNLLSVAERLNANTHYTGRGVVMAFIDAGFYLHPDLAGRVLVHADATTSRVSEQHEITEIDAPMNWHGQMTSVIAAGDGSLSEGQFRGLASGCELVLVKVSTRQRQVKEADILRGLRWVYDTHRRYNVRVVNISVGGDFVSHDPDHLLHRFVRKLVEDGVTVVAAAGNHGDDFVLPPASSPHAITVGGYDDSNSLDRGLWEAYHSNFGAAYDGSAKPDLIAPAAWIPSPILPETQVATEARWLAPLLNGNTEKALQRLLEEGYQDLDLSKETAQHPTKRLYTMLQERIHNYKLVDRYHHHAEGTSVAAPIVSSVVAQMLEANPTLTPERIKDILTRTATPLLELPPEQQGAGALNAAEAVRQAVNN